MDDRFGNYSWLNPPDIYHISDNELSLTTQPNTDFWQRTHYGFQNDNGHLFAFLTAQLTFTYALQARYAPQGKYDQAGIMVYIDAENWFKASVEYENEAISRLGSVVTNQGFSDWATTDITSVPEIDIHYRLSRRSHDFLIEQSSDGGTYQQLRIFHLLKADVAIRLGMYACSPQNSSFKAAFSNIQFGACVWESPQAPDE